MLGLFFFSKFLFVSLGTNDYFFSNFYPLIISNMNYRVYSMVEKKYEITNLLFVNYPKCSTCRKAKNWLDEHNIEYDSRHIIEDNPTAEELRKWWEISGLPLKRFFNTSGMKYRELKLKDKLPDMSEDEQLDLLATDGMLVKRPVLVSDDIVLVGFKIKEWEEKLL